MTSKKMTRSETGGCEVTTEKTKSDFSENHDSKVTPRHPKRHPVTHWNDYPHAFVIQ